MALKSKQTGVHKDAASPYSKISAASLSSLAASSPLYSCRSAKSPTITPALAASISLSSQRKPHTRQSDLAMVSGWLQAMKAASPPRAATLQSANFNGSRQAVLEAQYIDWVAKHPSALANFEKMMEAGKGKQVALFLDYDGTLSPIVEDPDRAYMSDAMRAAVKEVATHFPTAIISGRSRDKVYEFVQLAELFYAGSHGMDIMGPAEGCNGVKVDGTRGMDEKGNEIVFSQPASEFLPMMNEVCKALEQRSKNIQGAKIEHNKFCVSIHFRRVKEENWRALAEEVQKVLKNYPKLFLTQGRKVLELRPSIAWDKGKAVEFLMKALGLGLNGDVLPVYIGDDQTDEDAFSVLNEKHNGYSILVSNVAKKTNASFSLRDPCEVMDFVHSLVKWKLKSSHEQNSS
ncbi:hypothetical protein O6H91_08G115300 [Diphasiastrum complanatum]|uniref:Uncharacterized protein n=2 Tax=Diphasiastrum complanatum TaxID=34168 RepID=A0ACC2D1L2_DIPCM|nr:hypothetical protein O6H91_08G115300 [Diphasiastrum complanatum]